MRCSSLWRELALWARPAAASCRDARRRAAHGRAPNRRERWRRGFAAPLPALQASGCAEGSRRAEGTCRGGTRGGTSRRRSRNVDLPATGTESAPTKILRRRRTILQVNIRSLWPRRRIAASRTGWEKDNGAQQLYRASSDQSKYNILPSPAAAIRLLLLLQPSAHSAHKGHWCTLCSWAREMTESPAVLTGASCWPPPVPPRLSPGRAQAERKIKIKTNKQTNQWSV